MPDTETNDTETSGADEILPTETIRQLGDEIFRIGEDLREPIQKLAKSAIENSLDLARTAVRGASDLLEDVLGEAERATHNVSKRLREANRSAGEDT